MAAGVAFGFAPVMCWLRHHVCSAAASCCQDNPVPPAPATDLSSCTSKRLMGVLLLKLQVEQQLQAKEMQVQDLMGMVEQLLHDRC